MSDVWTLGKVVRWTQERFAERGVRTARLDAELIISHALQLDRVQLLLQSEKPLLTEERDKIKELIRRRLDGEPVAYIIGRKEFWGMSFEVNPAVLVPRPETEEIIEEAGKIFKSAKKAPLRFLDLGTGSGCISAALCAEFENAAGVAVDISQAALEVALRNFEKPGFASRISTRCGNFLDALKDGESDFDLVVSNPPYVPRGQIETLAPEVKKESRIALDGGLDGLDFVREIVLKAPKYMKDGAWLLIEIGAGQEETVSEIEGGELKFAGFRKDLSGIDRVAIWRKAKSL